MRHFSKYSRLPNWQIFFLSISSMDVLLFIWWEYQILLTIFILWLCHFIHYYHYDSNVHNRPYHNFIWNNTWNFSIYITTQIMAKWLKSFTWNNREFQVFEWLVFRAYNLMNQIKVLIFWCLIRRNVNQIYFHSSLI